MINSAPIDMQTWVLDSSTACDIAACCTIQGNGPLCNPPAHAICICMHACTLVTTEFPFCISSSYASMQQLAEACNTMLLHACAEEWYVHSTCHTQGCGDLVYRLSDGSDLVVENKFIKSMGSHGAQRSKRHSDVTAQALRYGNCWRCRDDAAPVVHAASFTPDRGLVVHKVWHGGMDSLSCLSELAVCGSVQESGAARAGQSDAVTAGAHKVQRGGCSDASNHA